jgi:hypothetical protein
MVAVVRPVPGEGFVRVEVFLVVFVKEVGWQAECLGVFVLAGCLQVFLQEVSRLL